MSIKIASLFAEIGIRDTLTPALQKSKQGLADMKTTMATATVAVAALTAAYYVAQKAVDATVGKFVTLANSVRTLDQINGDSAENNSRLIQTLDDYKISTEEIITAQRKLATQGESMNIPTLMRMSDAYLALNSGAERQAFLTENFGRNSAGWAEALAQGSAAIKAKNDAVSRGLILDEAALVKARQFELAMDDLSDAAQGVAVSIGQDLAPVMTKLATQYSEGVRLQQLYDQARELGIPITKNFITGQNQIHGSLVSNERLMQMVTEREEALARAAEKAQAQIELEDGAFFRFNQTLGDNADVIEDLGDKMNGIISYVDALKSADEEQTKQWIANMLLQKLSVDGLSDAEYDYYLQYMQTTGQMTAAQIANAEAAWDTVNALAAMADRTITVTINTVTTGQSYVPNNQGGNGSQPPPAPPSGGGNHPIIGYNPITQQPIYGNATGANFVVPPGYNNDNYLMGAKTGEHVSITPAGQSPAGGNTFNIYVNDPVAAAAEVAHIQEVNRLMGR